MPCNSPGAKRASGIGDDLKTTPEGRPDPRPREDVTRRTGMHVPLVGATGMIGRGALNACLLNACLRDPGVNAVSVVGRQAPGRSPPKLRELLLPDVADRSTVEAQLADVPSTTAPRSGSTRATTRRR